MDSLLRGVFASNAASIQVGEFMLCLVSALVLGLIMALMYMFKARYSGSFVATLALLPAVVCVVIMMVNGNIGAGVAVAGAFSLVRFRSAPGTGREITALFLAMGAGLICGMGYIVYAFIFGILVSLVNMVYCAVSFGGSRGAEKILRITVPEDLDYSGVFDDILNTYAARYELASVKTSNMGSLYKLRYTVTMQPKASERDMLDAIRCRNGNLEVSISSFEPKTTEL